MAANREIPDHLFVIHVTIQCAIGRDTNIDELRNHIRTIVPPDDIETIQLSQVDGEGSAPVVGTIALKPSVTNPRTATKHAHQLQSSSYNGARLVAQVDFSSLEPQEPVTGSEIPTRDKEEEEEEDDDAKEEEYDGTLNWNDAKLVAAKFFRWVQGAVADNDIDLTFVERNVVSSLFGTFFKKHNVEKNQKSRHYFEALVISVLRKQKLFKSKRYPDGVVSCSFARPDKTFAPFQERLTAKEKLMQQRREQCANKGGVHVPESPDTYPTGPVLPPVNCNTKVVFPLLLTFNANEPIDLVEASLTGGSQKLNFQIVTILPVRIDGDTSLELSFRSNGTGVYRVDVTMWFVDAEGERFSILRSVLLRTGDSKMYDLLKPTAPFAKKKRTPDKPVDENNVLHPPALKDRSGSGYKNLKRFIPPLDVREMVENKEMEGALVAPKYDTPNEEFPKLYSSFWQNLLWASELQAYEDIKLYDLENAKLQKSGRFFKLYVAGLAERRPSVLRGDVVDCFWRGKKYRGLVQAVELLDVLLVFHRSFHLNFDVRVDRVERVRFTFTRTAFRLSHEGALRAPKNMGQRMLMPQPFHMARLLSFHMHQRVQRKIPQQLAWASPGLNQEQQEAVQEIVKGTLCPMPYVIFGPPGTGKTTTMVEAIYQLARLHIYTKRQPKLNILVVSPSNDASDNLVEKLAPYFPPSEMIRVVAYTRSIDQVPPAVRPYVREGVEPSKLIPAIRKCQITVSTVNMAAKLWCMGVGINKGHFNVLCVDEAGHATEAEVIGVAATVMNFRGKAPGQLVLAGDPNQLGPIITSDLCKKFGMDVSYMERLVKTSPAYQSDEDKMYCHELVTLLVRNYRSHPAILKLPSEMFYDNKLISCGDKLKTHSMVNWEHLPSNKGFPIVFHAIDGENMREGNSPSWFNPQEAMEAVNYVKLLVKDSRPPVAADDIGIITPYARQVQKIRIALEANGLGGVKVGSVETFQGQERRCIIISTVRSENELLTHDRKFNLGFVANEKRFNVAVTRAIALLIIVGNPRVLATDEKNWLPLLRYCRDNQSWVGEDWNEDEADDNELELVADGIASTWLELEGEDDFELIGAQNCGFINGDE